MRGRNKETPHVMATLPRLYRRGCWQGPVGKWRGKRHSLQTNGAVAESDDDWPFFYEIKYLVNVLLLRPRCTNKQTVEFGIGIQNWNKSSSWSPQVRVLKTEFSSRSPQVGVL